MSFSIWPITFRHIRSTAFAEIPVGSDLASGRWVARISTIPVAGPRLTTSVQMSSNSVAVLGVLEHDLALIHPDHDRVQPQALVAGQVGGDLVFRADVAGQAPDHLGAAAQLLPQRAEVGQRVGQVLVVVPGPVPVRHRLQRGQVAGALEVIQVQLGAHVQGGDQQPAGAAGTSCPSGGWRR